MKTIHEYTDAQKARVAALNERLEKRLAEDNQGSIRNEDIFEKRGLIGHLQELPEYRETFVERAVKKIGCKPS